MATTNNIPQKLDWVTERANCTAAKVFNELCEAIEIDVLAINTVRGLSADNVFLANMSRSGFSIIVGQSQSVPRKVAVIGIEGDRITIEQQWNGGEKWSATVGLNDEGRCTLRLEDGGTELEQWQFRKRALEGLFFGRIAP